MVEHSDGNIETMPPNEAEPLVLVRWVDSSGFGTWTTKEESKKGKLLECETIGRLLNQDVEATRIASTRDPYGKVMDVNLIPTPNVLEIIYLRPYKKAPKENA